MSFHFGLVLLKDLTSEYHEVRWPLTAGLANDPQFKILRPVVGPNAIEMMHLFTLPQWPTKHGFHDHSMLRTLPAVHGDDPVSILVDVTSPVVGHQHHRVAMPTPTVVVTRAPTTSIDAPGAAVNGAFDPSPALPPSLVAGRASASSHDFPSP